MKLDVRTEGGSFGTNRGGVIWYQHRGVIWYQQKVGHLVPTDKEARPRYCACALAQAVPRAGLRGERGKSKYGIGIRNYIWFVVCYYKVYVCGRKARIEDSNLRL